MQSRKESIKPGARFTVTRTFSREDVEIFTRISGDRGRHHLEPDARGRVMVQGLLTASLTTEIGGSIDFLASEMQLQYLRPVFTGDALTGEVWIEELREEPGRRALVCGTRVVNQNGKEVLAGTVRGVVLT